MGFDFRAGSGILKERERERRGRGRVLKKGSFEVEREEADFWGGFRELLLYFIIEGFFGFFLNFHQIRFEFIGCLVCDTKGIKKFKT